MEIKTKGGLKSSEQEVLVVESNFVENSKGRHNSLSKEKLEELLRLYYTEPWSLRQLAERFGVSRMTVWRAVQTARVFVSTR